MMMMMVWDSYLYELEEVLADPTPDAAASKESNRLTGILSPVYMYILSFAYPSIIISSSSLPFTLGSILRSYLCYYQCTVSLAASRPTYSSLYVYQMNNCVKDRHCKDDVALCDDGPFRLRV